MLRSFRINRCVTGVTDRLCVFTRKPQNRLLVHSIFNQFLFKHFFAKEAGPLISCIPSKFFGLLQQGLKKWFLIPSKKWSGDWDLHRK